MGSQIGPLLLPGTRFALVGELPCQTRQPWPEHQCDATDPDRSGDDHVTGDSGPTGLEGEHHDCGADQTQPDQQSCIRGPSTWPDDGAHDRESPPLSNHRDRCASSACHQINTTPASAITTGQKTNDPCQITRPRKSRPSPTAAIATTGPMSLT